MKEVTVYATQGEAKVKFETEAATWGELQNDLKKNNVSYNSKNMRAVIGETRNTVEVDKAVLPDSNFTLFLMQKKSKAGISEYRETKNKVKAILKANPDAKSFFTVNGRNYTQLTTEVLKERLAAWEGENGTTSANATSEEVTEHVVHNAVKTALDILKAIPADKLEEIADEDAYDEITDAVDALTIAEEDLRPVNEEEAQKEADRETFREVANDFEEL